MRNRITLAVAAMAAALGYPMGAHGPAHSGCHVHGSAGYATPGAFGRSRLGARRSIRRARQISQGKFVRR